MPRRSRRAGRGRPRCLGEGRAVLAVVPRTQALLGQARRGGRGLEDRDDFLLATLAEVGPELGLERSLELAARLEFLADVGAADELTLHEDLGNRRPARLCLQLLA